MQELQYQRDASVHPLELVDRVSLALHHHIAPADETDEEEELG